MACLDGTEEDVLKNIKQVIRDGMDALNIGFLDETQYPWTCLAPDYLMHNPSGMRRAAKTKSEALEDWRTICAANPTQHFKVNDIAAHMREQKGGERVVETFVKLEVSGLPGIMEGTARKIVSMMEWRCRDGEWFIVSETTVDGMGDADVGSS